MGFPACLLLFWGLRRPHLPGGKDQPVITQTVAELEDLLRLSVTLFAEVAKGSTRMYKAQTALISGFWCILLYGWLKLRTSWYAHISYQIESQNILSG